MLQAVICCIVTVIFTKELVIATDQCTEYQFKTPYFIGTSCEEIYNDNPDSQNSSGYYWIIDSLRQVYCGMNYTGSSCEDIYNNNPETGDKSGYYHINENWWTYCNMTAIAASDFSVGESGDFISTCAGVGGGWRRIVKINISAGDDCPDEWRKATQSGVSFCRVASNDIFTCSSANFSTNGTSYQRVCGRARGYQKGETFGFYGTLLNRNIDQDYVSGLSITYSHNPRQHIWTYASGVVERSSIFTFACPCASNVGLDAPTFVGSHYYCESGTTLSYSAPSFTIYTDDPLWDGAGCTVSNCCNNTTQPWFYRQLSQTIQDDIEARICAHGPFIDRSPLIDQLELYIQ